MTLDRLLGALPEQIDLAPLRQALLRASTTDASRSWSRSSAYATFDKRVIQQQALPDIVAGAALEAHARVDALYRSIGKLLDHIARGEDVQAGTLLIEMGVAAEAQNHLRGAIDYFEVAAHYSAGLADRKLRILALRHLARAHFGLGDMERARAFYGAALQQATAAGEVEWQIVALTGMGNVYVMQGHWNDAITQYQAARVLCGDDFARKRGQLAINLALMHRERGELDSATAELALASDLWHELDRADQSAWYNYSGLIALTRAEFDAAETAFRQALETADSDFGRAMVLDNLAELFIQRGNLTDAETLGRSAEELALRAGSPRALAEIYTRLGKTFRLRADLDGVTFFEKALELCRGQAYPLTEANAYLEYGIFRRILGDAEEARSCIERALQICAQIGAEQLQQTAQQQMALL